MCHYETYKIETINGLIDVYFEKQSKLFCLVHTVNNILQAHVYSPNDFKEVEINLNHSPTSYTHELNNNSDSRNVADDTKKNNNNSNDQGNNINIDENLNIKQQLDIKRKDNLNKDNISTYVKKCMYYFGNFNINVLYLFLSKYNIELEWVDNNEIFEKINEKRKCNVIFDDNHLNNKELIGFVINVVRLNFLGLYYHRHFYTIRKISGMWFNLDSKLAKPALFYNNAELNEHLIKLLKDNKNYKSDNYIIQVFKKKKNN
ncbi:conserved protein, unknown function [Hepatocystis sp. ex Piliocolobus tephrosceles]|nr:conserved protein, unknown function [Hepatocystis sp. ex Piliocolobus tephrosceles]